MIFHLAADEIKEPTNFWSLLLQVFAIVHRVIKFHSLRKIETEDYSKRRGEWEEEQNLTEINLEM